eukprot:scaffold9237_cov72-Skeletonema_dohrnii-CCMP3373.AAC.1
MQENNNLNMDIDIDKEDQRQLPHCSMATDDGDGDEYVISKRANALMSGSVQRVSGASVTAGDDPTLSGEDVPTPHARPDPPDDVLDDVNMITPAPAAASLDSDRVELCEEGCSLPMQVDGEYDGHKDSDRDSNSELQPLHRHPSIVTLTPQSDLNKRVLSEDTFSFLIYSHVRSRAFFLATFVFTFQIAIYSVLLYDITNFSSQRNPLKIPAGVETPVRIASALAIVVAIITQDDARKMVNLLRDGFDQDLVNAFQGTTKTKWVLSIVLRGSEGLMGLFLTFLLIMQATTVLDLLLNFLAMEFVSHLDDVVFVLTKEGFFGANLQNESTKLSNTFYHASHLWTESRAASIVTKTYFIFLFTIMFVAWGIISYYQVSGKYLCNQIFAQFSDEIMPELGSFTGLFYVHTQRFGGRSSYRDNREGSMLAYCKNETRWTLSLTEGEDANPCNWTAASSESTSFDLLSTTSSPWVIKIPSNIEAPLTHYLLACYECENLNIPENNGICMKAQKPEKFDYSICRDGYYGLSCEHSDSEDCQILEIKPSSKDDGGGGLFASRYYRLEGAYT